MPRNPRLTALRRTGWVSAIVLAILGILLGAQPLTRAGNVAGRALGDATRAAVDSGWLLLLLVPSAWCWAWGSVADWSALWPVGCDPG